MLFRSQVPVCLLIACLAAGSASDSRLALGEDASIPRSEWEARIEAALSAKGAWEFVDAPLNEVCAAIQKKLDINIVLDVKSLEDFGIDPGTPITASLHDISNRSCLRLMLRDLQLTYTIRLGGLWITTTEEAESQLVTTVYPVGDLLTQDSNYAEPVFDYDSLEQAIMSLIAPDTWDQVGGPGVISGIYGSLAVSQTADIHKQVSTFLQAYRVIVENDRDADVTQPTAIILGQQEYESIRAALDEPVTVETMDASFSEVIRLIGESMQIPIVIDSIALEDFGIDLGTPITVDVKDIPLRFALPRILNELELTYTLRDEVLLVTTPEVDESQLLIGFYPVRDLVQKSTELPDDSSGRNADFDSLTQLITATIDPDSWDEVGGPGAIEPLVLGTTLVVSQTRATHEQIADLLAKLRAAKQVEAARSAAQEEVDPTALIVRAYQVRPSFSGPDEIVKLVMRAFKPGTWDDEEGTFIQGLGTSIVVKHDANVHREVQKLLTQLHLLGPFPHGTQQGFGGGGGGGGVSAPGGGGGVF